jgi:hypothetical protein
MRKDVSNIQSLAVVMDRGDYSKLVSTDIEYREGRNVVRRAKGPLDRIEVQKFTQLHDTEPCHKRSLCTWMHFPELAQSLP